MPAPVPEDRTDQLESFLQAGHGPYFQASAMSLALAIGEWIDGRMLGKNWHFL